MNLPHAKHIQNIQHIWQAAKSCQVQGSCTLPDKSATESTQYSASSCSWESLKGEAGRPVKIMMTILSMLTGLTVQQISSEAAKAPTI